MNISNTSDVPLAVFHLRASGERSAHVVEPGADLALELAPGDSVKARVATEITNPADAIAADAQSEA